MRYTSDLTDNEWHPISYCFPPVAREYRHHIAGHGDLPYLVIPVIRHIEIARAVYSQAVGMAEPRRGPGDAAAGPSAARDRGVPASVVTTPSGVIIRMTGCEVFFKPLDFEQITSLLYVER